MHRIDWTAEIGIIDSNVSLIMFLVCEPHEPGTFDA